MTRATVILGIVVGLTMAARSFLPPSVTITGSGAALAFGFLLLAALQSGIIVQALRMPHLTGFILCGAIFGPELLGLITPAMLKDLTLVKKVAVGLIALNAGCELNFAALRPKIKTISVLSAFALVASGLFVFLGIFVASFFASNSEAMSFLADMTIAQRLIVALVCANVLIALSPAVVMGILSESRARGPLSELTLSIVVLADLVVAITFAFSDSAVRGVFPDLGGGGEGGSVFGALAVHILGSIVVGVGVGAVFALYMRRVGLRIGLFIFAVCFVVAEAGTSLHLDPLLVFLAAGIFLENVSPVSGHEVIHQIEAAAMPTFAVFFAVIGAEVHIHSFLLVAPFAIGVAIVRAFGLYAGSWMGARMAKLEPAVGRRIPLGMIPQAGIALVLADLVNKSFPPWGKGAATLLLGTVMVNQLIGPVLFRMGLIGAGEAGKKGVESGHTSRPELEHEADKSLAVAMPTQEP